MRVSNFDKKLKSLTYFVDKDTIETVSCENITKAKNFLKSLRCNERLNVYDNCKLIQTINLQ